MDIVSKLSAVAFWLVAAAVALHFILTPFYDDATNVYRVWDILDWFMAVVVVVALVLHCLRKHTLDRRRDDVTITREYLEVNLAVYGSAALTLWFFWNWFDALTIGPDLQSDIRMLMWAFVNPLFVLICGVTGCYLWRSSLAR